MFSTFLSKHLNNKYYESDSTREASFNGGDYITFRGKLEGDAYFTTRLFKSHLHLSSSPITISFSVTSDETSKHGILLSFSSPSHETKSILVSRQESICRFNNMFLQCLATSAQTVSEWTVQETSLVLDGHRLTEISAFCYRPENLTKRTEYVALLGHLRSCSVPAETRDFTSGITVGH